MSKNQSVSTKEADNRFHKYYLFSSEVDQNGAVVKGTLDVVANRVFLSEDTRLPLKQRSDAPLVPWCTDERGLIWTVSTRKAHGKQHLRGNCPLKMKWVRLFSNDHKK